MQALYGVSVEFKWYCPLAVRWGYREELKEKLNRNRVWKTGKETGGICFSWCLKMRYGKLGSHLKKKKNPSLASLPSSFCSSKPNFLSSLCFFFFRGPVYALDRKSIENLFRRLDCVVILGLFFFFSVFFFLPSRAQAFSHLKGDKRFFSSCRRWKERSVDGDGEEWKG